MTEHERLVELLKATLFENIGKSVNLAENIADYLLANGVFVMPCKVGDELYFEKDGKITCSTVDRIEVDILEDDLFEVFYTAITGYGYSVTFEDVGKLVFTTREEAEKALKERENNA